MDHQPRKLGIRLGLLAAAAVLAACAAASTGSFPSGNPPAANLLVISADPTVPPQLIPASSIPANNVLNITLSKGTQFNGFVSSSAGVPVNCTVDIRMRGAGIDTVLTRPNGQFTVNLAQGIYDFTVTPNPQIVTNKSLPPFTFQSVVVPSNGTSISHTFTMYPGYDLPGVLSIQGGPTPDGWSISAQNSAGTQTSSIGNSTITGGFNIFTATTGNWLVTAVPPTGSTAFPVVTKTVAVVPTNSNLFFTIPALPAPVSLSGTVSGSAGVAIPTGGFGGITVRAIGEIPSTTDTTLTMTLDTTVETNSAGNFTFPQLIPGTYTLYVEPGISFPFSQIVVPAFTVGSSMTIAPASTVLQPKFSLSGTVVSIATGDAAANAEIDFSAADGTLYQFPDLTDGNGNYQLTVNQGVYNVTIIPGGDSGLVRSVNNVIVNPASSPLGFTLASGQVVSGRVFESDGITSAVGATVIAVDAAGQPTGSQQSITNANGGWALTLPVTQPAFVQTIP